MSLPDLPPTFKPVAPPVLDWWWQLYDAGGEVVETPAGVADERFPNRGDAESWIGELWRDLAEAGVASAQLHEDEATVGGRLDLHE